MANFLILDEEVRCRRRLAAELARRGHRVRAAGVAALGPVLSQLLRPDHPRPDVIVIDPYPTRLDPVLTLRMLRTAARRPVLVTTVERPDADATEALNAGADGWLPKPVSPDLLAALAAAVLRRMPAARRTPAIRVGELSIDLSARRVVLRGVPVALTRAEFDLLAGLSESVGRAVPRSQLLSRIRRGRAATPNLVDVLLCRLRAKLGESATRSRYLHTVRGRGVRLWEV